MANTYTVADSLFYFTELNHKVFECVIIGQFNRPYFTVQLTKFKSLREIINISLTLFSWSVLKIPEPYIFHLDLWPACFIIATLI